MSTKIRFYRDRSQQPRAVAGQEYALLADYLESDVQDTETAADVNTMLSQQVASRGDQEISGNSYTLVLQGEDVCLENMFDDTLPLYRCPLEPFMVVLTAWHDFLENDNLLSLVPVF